jgi:hypothetical protein
MRTVEDHLHDTSDRDKTPDKSLGERLQAYQVLGQCTLKEYGVIQHFVNWVHEHEQAYRKWAVTQQPDESEETLDLLADWEHLVAVCAEARRIVNTQAEDEGLWFEATTISEAYLQQELRRLHAAVERLRQLSGAGTPPEAVLRASPGEDGDRREPDLGKAGAAAMLAYYAATGDAAFPTWEFANQKMWREVADAVLRAATPPAGGRAPADGHIVTLCEECDTEIPNGELVCPGCDRIQQGRRRAPTPNEGYEEGFQRGYEAAERAERRRQEAVSQPGAGRAPEWPDDEQDDELAESSDAACDAISRIRDYLEQRLTYRDVQPAMELIYAVGRTSRRHDKALLGRAEPEGERLTAHRLREQHEAFEVLEEAWGTQRALDFMRGPREGDTE